MKKIVALLLLITFASSCEKDDICDANTPTTPRLVISFYNFTAPSVLKNVTNLKVIGDGMPSGIVFNPNLTGENRYLTNGSSISIPLKTAATTTKYRFVLNSGNPDPRLVDTDEISFNYTTEEVYVSRACGFKTLFTFVPKNSFTHAAVPVTKAKWMQVISVEKNNIVNENETHIKVFF
jgi:hypothetical protein